jgi:hypothetical protein
MADDEPTVDDEQVAGRASELLPEEQAAGSDDPDAQAEAILTESEDRKADPDPDPDAVERRTSEDVTPDPR